MSRVFVFTVLFMVSASALSDATPPYPFPIPKSVATASEDTSGRTWRMTGSATNSYDAVHGEFEASFKSAGYSLRHEIPMDDKGNRTLSSWRKKGSELILMLWPNGTNDVGFAWGEVSSPTAPKASSGLAAKVDGKKKEMAK